jgi:serine/threonine protein phosphatase PrpC
MTRRSGLPVRKDDLSEERAAAGLRVALASYQGDRPYQEDRFLIETADITAKGAKLFLSEIFSAAAKRTDGNDAGATGTAMVLSKDLTLTAAFVGDSPVVVFIRDPATGEIEARKLTRDHHARESSEKARIEREGGRVARNGRVMGSLELSRAFGDAGYLGVSQIPEFAKADLKKEIDGGRDVYICVSSDGLYAALEREDYVQPLKDAIAAGREAQLADIFAAHAYASGSGDNITALVVKVPAAMTTGLFLAIADGHGGAETAQQVVESFRGSIAARKATPPSPSA